MSDERRDKRRWPRYTAIDKPGALGWWVGTSFRNVPARLINIGPGGALVSTAQLPPEKAPVWLCATGGEWVEATVVPAPRLPFGPYRIRLRFSSPPAPGAFLKAATEEEGPPPDGAVLEALRTLGLRWPASPSEVKSAYRRLAQREHPDHGGAVERFARINEAYVAALDGCRRPGQPDD